MKKVFSTSYEVASLWINQAQEEARCRNSSFHGQKYYSYSTEIARLRINVLGYRLILITDRDYSKTTSKHKADVYRVAQHENIISVSDVDGNHKLNYACFLDKQVGLLDLASRARKRKDFYLYKVEAITNDMKLYARFFDLTWLMPSSELGITAVDVLKSIKVQEQMMKPPQSVSNSVWHESISNIL
jgi:hypothetical protein